MKNIIIYIFIVFSFGLNLKAQENDYWFLFQDDKTNLLGFKDIQGNIKIKPKFTGLIGARLFKNIIPVSEKKYIDDFNNYESINYYLLKNGRKVGVDSLYLSPDIELDCENEGKIRFRDNKKTRKVGFFDYTGEIVIPCEYDEASRFYNGLAVMLKNGKRTCYDKEKSIEDYDCEHWFWEGNWLLINDKNEVLIENLNLADIVDIDWYSFKMSEDSISNGTYKSFPAKNGYISFKDLKVDFENWFKTVFLKNIDDKQCIKSIFLNEITIGKKTTWKSNEKFNGKFQEYAWFIDTKENFWLNNESLFENEVLNFLKEEFEFSIRKGDTPILFNEYNNFDYQNDCGWFDNERFPYFKVSFKRKDKRNSFNYFGFIKTDVGYKLLEIN